MFKTLPASYTETQILDLIVAENLHRRHLNPGQTNAFGLEYIEHCAAIIQADETARKHEQAQRAERDISGRFNAADRITPDLGESGESRKTRHAREAAAKAAKIVGGSRSGVQQAKAVKRDAPDLYEQVRAGKVALDAADRKRRRPLGTIPKISRIFRGYAARSGGLHCNYIPIETR